MLSEYCSVYLINQFWGEFGAGLSVWLNNGRWGVLGKHSEMTHLQTQRFMYSNNTWQMVRTGETSDIYCMQDILWNGMHSSLHRFMRIRKISLRCFSLSLAADAWRKKRKPHAYPRQSTNTHAVNTHQNNDITYFGGPRLQAVGIATDEESHFPNKRGKLSNEREKQERVPLRIQTNKHSTWPWSQRTSESRSIRVIRDHQKRAWQDQFCAHLCYRTPSRPISTPQTSSSHEHNSRSPENSTRLHPSGPVLHWRSSPTQMLSGENNRIQLWGSSGCFIQPPSAHPWPETLPRDTSIDWMLCHWRRSV